MEQYLEFSALIEEFLDLFDTFSSVEQRKLDATVENKILDVEDCMKKEQALTLQLRGLEQRREAQQEALGMKDMSFREILEKIPKEAKQILEPLFRELSGKVEKFQTLNESAKDAINVNLHNVQAAIRETSGMNSIYSPKGEKDSEENHFTDRFI